MLKVLQVYKNYAPMPGGIETYLRQIATGLNRRGRVKVSVLVTAPGPRTVVDEIDGVRVTRAGRLGEVASTPLSLRLIEQVRQSDADILHLHVPYPVGELAALSFAGRRRIVVTYHSDVVRQWWARPLYQPMLRQLLRRADALIATSPAYLKSSAILSHFAAHAEVIPLSVDPARFVAEESAVAALRQRWPEPVVLFVGRFRSYKGLPILLQAMSGLDARLILIGQGPLEAALRAQAVQLGIDERVTFLGDVSDRDLTTYYALAKVFVLPSTQRSEAFGIALLEAMAAGRPVISTELGTGTSWVNQHGKTGFVVPQGDPQALREAIRTLLEDRALAERLGQAGRQRVQQEFSEDRMLESIEGVYLSFT
ncbi:MAG TPA: glycosyltransferase [Chloroflexota bacterium]|nr:glycosyltransferase [Chloroflexota bacterium]